MGNYITVLQVGRADCMVLQFQQGDDKKVVVIDGGTYTYKGEAVLNQFLLRNHIACIDLVVITHLHQDHFGGFASLDPSIQVREAIVPVNGDCFTETVCQFQQENNCFDQYVRFWNRLKAMGTTIHYPFEANCPTGYTYGTYCLRRLYPHTGRPSVVAQSIAAMCQSPIGSDVFETYYEAYRTYCNQESSIWSVETQGVCKALLLGDSTVDVFNQIWKEDSMPVPIVKLSHHGIDTRYYNREQLESLNPRHLIVTTEPSFTAEFLGVLETVKRKAQIDVDYTYTQKELIYAI